MTWVVGSHLLGNELTNIQFSPASPASIDWEEQVVITFDYQTEETEGIRVSCTAYSTSHDLNTAWAGSRLLTGQTGSSDTYFIVRSGEGILNTVILRMKSAATGDIIFEKKMEDLAYSCPKVIDGEEIPYPECSETRVVPHITAYGGLFETMVIVQNFSNAPQSFVLTPYGADGNKYQDFTDHLEAQETAYFAFEDIFPAEQTAYFTINPEAKIVVDVAYTSTMNGSPAFARERCRFAKRWALTPGNWNLVFDGLAIVNMGDAETNFVLSQYDSTNNLIHSQVIAEAVQPGQKVLYVLDAHFSDPANTRFVFESDHKVAFLALSGSLPGSESNFLWENAAFPLD